MDQKFYQLKRALEDEKSTSGRQKLLKQIYAFKLADEAAASEELHKQSPNRLNITTTRRSVSGNLQKIG